VAVLRKTHLSDPVMHYLQTDKAVYEFDDKVPAHLDGELVFQQRFDISTHPAALRMIYNPGGSHYFAEQKGSGTVA
jgi:diacylglycerol kinase family enzyme